MDDNRLQRHELGFFEIKEKPSREKLAEYYANIYYQHESSSYQKNYSPLELETIHLRLAQRTEIINELRKHKQPGRMLDVGCGEGFTIKHFHMNGWQVSGMDFSRAGVEQINPDYASFVQNGDVFQLLEEKIKSEERYDMIWLGNVLEHVLDPISLLEKLRRIIATDGILVTTVPNDGSLYQESLLQKNRIPRRFWIAIPDHMSYFTAESLKNTAEATGWRCESLLADFPIDVYLAHSGSNYVTDPTQGAAAHQARLELEQIIGKAGAAAANRFYAALAEVGLGRNLTAYLRPRTNSQQINENQSNNSHA